MKKTLAKLRKKPDRKEWTRLAFDEPQPGDRFSEFLSFWVSVEAVSPDGTITVIEGGSPNEGVRRVFKDKEEFKAAYRYGGTPGYWVSLFSRKINGERILTSQLRQ